MGTGSMTTAIDAFGLTDVGRKRKHNEDAYAVDVNEKTLSLAHVGDSRAYLFRDGTLTRLTDDHSWVHEQVAAGILTEEEAKSHPLKNVVTRALGGGPSVSPDLQELTFRPGDEFIFCSDGLTTMLSDEEIHDTAEKEREPQSL